MPQEKGGQAFRRPRLQRSSSRLFADPVQTAQEWDKHRNAYYRHAPQPSVLLSVIQVVFVPLVYVCLLCVLVGLYQELLVPRAKGKLPPLSNQFDGLFQATTFALSLLLVFKTNSSYSRWWEGRKAWGQITSASQNLLRQASAYLPPEDAALLEGLARWIAAMAWSVKAMFRPNSDLASDLQGVLPPVEAAWLLSQRHKALAACQVLSASLASAHVDELVRLRMDDQVAILVLYWGALARIYSCAIPRAYTRHTSRFLITYVTFLPLMLWGQLGWFTPVGALVAAFLLLGTENIGAAIEEPCHVLPLDAFCKGIEADCLAIIKGHQEADDPASQPWPWLLRPAGGSRAISGSTKHCSSRGAAPGGGTGWAQRTGVEGALAKGAADAAAATADGTRAPSNEPAPAAMRGSQISWHCEVPAQASPTEGPSVATDSRGSVGSSADLRGTFDGPARSGGGAAQQAAASRPAAQLTASAGVATGPVDASLGSPVPEQGRPAPLLGAFQVVTHR